MKLVIYYLVLINMILLKKLHFLFFSIYFLQSMLADLMWEVASESVGKVSQICGVPYTALPLATLISAQTNIPMLIKRKEAKLYGTKKLLEGIYSRGDNCLIIEDVITSGSSILETADILRKEQLNVKQAVVVIDREQGAMENLENHGIKVKSLYTVTTLMQYLLELGKITEAIVKDVNNYIKMNRVQKISALGKLTC